MAFVHKTVEIRADVRRAYELWTAFEDYPKFMALVDRLDVFEEGRLHWVAVLDEEVVEWDADLVEHVADERITWYALDGRETGQVRFEKMNAASTRVHYQLEYDPAIWPGSPDTVRHWMRRRLESDLEAFKQLAEADA
jgi:uncharacterized membrane protein